MGWTIYWFGIVAVIMVEVATSPRPWGWWCTRPRGIAGPSVELMTIFRVVIPFVFVQLLTVFTLYLFPEIATFLPSKM